MPKPTNLRVEGAGSIPAPPIPRDAALRFSFKFLDLLGNNKFCTSHCQEGYLDKFLTRLRDISGLTVNEFRTNKTDALRAHTITFTDTSEPEGFSSLNPQLRQSEAYQFMITKKDHGRVHGILLSDTFYVVWIDPAHKLYS